MTEGTTLTLVGFSVLCGISFVGSFIAASLGLGGGLLVLATMTLFLPPTVLIPVHAVVQIGSNGFRALLMRREILTSVIPAFLLGTLLGSWLGGLTIFALEVWVLQSILGIFVLYATWTPKFRSSNPGPAKFFGCGVFGGFATMFVGGTGPLVAPFVNAACKERQQVVATHASLMTLQHHTTCSNIIYVSDAIYPQATLDGDIGLFLRKTNQSVPLSLSFRSVSLSICEGPLG